MQSSIVCAEKMMQQINSISPQHVSALVTDNASNCKLARETVCKAPGFVHIIALRYLFLLNYGTWNEAKSYLMWLCKLFAEAK